MRLAEVRGEFAKLDQVRAQYGQGYAKRQEFELLSREQAALAEVFAKGRDRADNGQNAQAFDGFKIDATGDQAAAAQKHVRELVERLDELPRKREQLHNAVQRINDDFAQGRINAEQWTQAIGPLNAALASLRSPLERSQTELDNAAARAGAPRNQRAYLGYMQGVDQQALGIPEIAADGSRPREEFINNKREVFNTQLGIQDQDAIADLQAAARNMLEASQAFARGPAAALRSQAYGTAAEQARTGNISDGAVGGYAQSLLAQGAAGQVFDFAGTTQAYGEQTAALERLVAAEGLGAAATREAERANQVAIATSRLRAAVEAAGSEEIAAAAQKQIEAYEALSRRQAEAQQQREAIAFNQQYDPSAAFEQSMSRLADLQATGLLSERTVYEATKDYELRRLEASRNATDGAIAGFRRYADEATNAGRSASDGIRTAMRSAEDAVANFAVTGSFNFNSFANSVLADIARVATRQAITGPLASAAGSALGSVGSWLGNILGGSSAGTGAGGSMNPFDGGGLSYGGPRAGGGDVDPDHFYKVGENGEEWFVPPTAGRIVNRQQMADLSPQLAANEMPIVAKRGERVLTEGQQRALGIDRTNPDVLTGSGQPVSAVSRSGGGIADAGAPSARRPADLWIDAPRFHDGGLVLAADEVPTVAKRGERVLTEEQQRAWTEAGNGGDHVPSIGPDAGSGYRPGGMAGHGLMLAADEVPIIVKRGERVLTEEQQRAWGGVGHGGDRVPAIGPDTGSRYRPGGIADNGGTHSGRVPAEAWAAAPRFHEGGTVGDGPVLAANEMPIIAKRGERVLTEEQQRAWNASDGGGASVVVEVKIENNTSANVRAEQGTSASGKPMLKVIVEQAEQGIATNITQGRGPVFKAVKAAFGVQPVARPA